MRTDQKRLAVADVDVGLGELRAPGAHRLDLPAFQRQPGLDAILDKIVVARAPILGDDALGDLRFRHAGIVQSLSRRPRLSDTSSMRDLTRSALVARPPALLYRLVEEVERYPEFVPGCSAAQVLERGENQV